MALYISKKASKLIAEQIGHVLDLTEWEVERFLEIKDIGPVVAENVKAWFSEHNNVEMLNRMEAFGVNLTQTEEDKPLKIETTALPSP